jgi:hypothetical protein
MRKHAKKSEPSNQQEKEATMGATAEDRLTKRRINELEEQLRGIQRELQKLKDQSRKADRLKKQLSRSMVREAELSDLIEDQGYEEAASVSKHSHKKKEGKKNHENHHNQDQEKHVCRKSNCQSDDVTTIDAGNRQVLRCNKCGGRYTIQLSETKDEQLAIA